MPIFVMFCLNIFSSCDSLSHVSPILFLETRNVLFRDVLYRDILVINIQNWNILREEKFREKLYQGYFD
jgi:hypothetical protein